MPRKVVPIISVIILSVLAGWFLFESNSVDKELMEWR